MEQFFSLLQVIPSYWHLLYDLGILVLLDVLFLLQIGMEKENLDIWRNQSTQGVSGSGNDGWPIEKFLNENILLVEKFADQINFFLIGIFHFRPSLPLNCGIIIDPTPHFFDKLGWDSISNDRLNPRFFNKSPKERRFLSRISIDSDILEIIGRKIGIQLQKLFWF